MATYRLFFIGRDDHIVKAEVVYCPTDDDAIAAARAACREHPAVEVWELARKVERVDADIAANYRCVVKQRARTDTESQKSVVDQSEELERAYLDTEAGADFAARAISHDVVGEWLLSLALGTEMRA